MNTKSLRYSLFKRLVDRRNAGRDGRSGLPVYAEQPAPTPYIRRLVAEFVEQVAAERECLDRETAPLLQDLASLTVDIQQTTDVGRQDPEVAAWRQKRALQAKQARQARRQRLEEAVASQHKQYLNRQNQLAAYTWRRIETYRDRLMQVHPDGELLNEWTNDWGPAQLDGPLRQLIELGEQLVRRDQSSKAIGPSEND